ncbi:MAG: DNA repair protein RecN [Candidatus Polarisedimenticolaceae bacterium]|nr:DNA repair protein RecN [Candidatus Polarisedimenticolaceae bacterium]
MLTHLYIKDLAVVRSVELELDAGMTTLTGETGAGKSILIDALGLGLGNRADKGMIRTGSDRAEITLTFDTTSSPVAQHWLQEHTLDAGSECLLRRVLLRDGRSRAFINGAPTPLQLLQSLGELLVDIHGQHAHQSLLKRSCQRTLLDAYAGHSVLTNQVQQQFQEWRNCQETLEQLQRASADRTAQLDLLRYQVNELETLQLSQNELSELDSEHSRLSHVGKLQETVALALTRLYDGDGSVQEVVAHLSGELEALLPLDSQLSSSQELLASALIQIEEATTELRHYSDTLELNPIHLEQLEQRLEEIHDLARKYRVPPAELPEKLVSLKAELNTLEQSAIHLSKLEAQLATLRSGYLEAAKKLSGSRHKAAKKLQKSITKRLHSLGMPQSVFSIAIEPLPEERATRNGLDQIEFLISTNPGQTPQPLSRVASGGELSRISLAIQVATLQCGQVPTLIFDEVDTGIGGSTAEIVGKLLRQLGETRQVLCVTHLPQVAAQGHHHLQISKQSHAKSTHTTVQRLQKERRVQEIARMLGGMEITEQTLAHAQEMLSRSAG